ncbi:MAG: hypothetical protein F6K11_21135 [Leptolyngbya sp. SIO3F4]|nr:hypothetical protein [Leptolyngbya sp. SIO3F4]
MSNSIETLLFLYKEQTEQARHHEQQRATITNYVLVVAGAALGLLSIDGFSGNLPVGVFLIGLGIFGCIASAKHYERNRYHSRMARAYRRKIEEVDANAKIDRDNVRDEQKSKFPVLEKLGLFRLWMLFHVFISALGLIIIWL